jgi:predicted transcriptional regulator
MLRILQQKKIVTAKKIGKQHIYLPALSKPTFASYAVKKIVNQVFSGDSVQMVAYLMNKKNFSMDEIKAIEHLLEQKKKEIEQS